MGLKYEEIFEDWEVRIVRRQRNPDTERSPCVFLFPSCQAFALDWRHGAWYNASPVLL